MSEKLKPCPFCGGENLKFYFSKGHGDLHEYAFTGFCCQNEDCGVVVQLHLLDMNEWTEESAYEFCAEKWNKRAETMTEKLKPCPFCGGEAELHTDPEDEFWAVDCLNIDCILCKTRYYATKQKAIEAWNRRADND